METADVDEVVAILAVTFPGFQVTAMTQVAWRATLADSDSEEVRASVKRFTRGQAGERNNAFAPSTAELLAEVEAYRKAGVVAAANESMRLEADNRAVRNGQSAEWQEANVREAASVGYTDSRAYFIDKQAGALVPQDDAPHRYFDWRSRRVQDDRKMPRAKPMPAKRGGGASIGEVLGADPFTAWDGSPRVD